MASASFWMWQCSQGRNTRPAAPSNLTPMVTPACEEGQGSYVSVTVQDLTIQQSIDPTELAFFVSASLLMWTVGLGLGWIYSTIRRAKV